MDLNKILENPIFVLLVVPFLMPQTINFLIAVQVNIVDFFLKIPKYRIGVIYDWAQLPKSGSIFPKSVVVKKGLLRCYLLDISKGDGGTWSLPWFRMKQLIPSIIKPISKSDALMLLNNYKSRTKI